LFRASCLRRKSRSGLTGLQRWT